VAHGGATRLAEEVPLERVAVIMARQEHPVTLVLVMGEEAVVEYQVPLAQVVREEMEVFLQAAAAVAERREL